MIIKTTEQGLKAETAVAGLLKDYGYIIIDRNWKTKVCEIDIVAEKSGTIYFVEVKYRRSDFQGDGFEHITLQKLHKMSFAAEVWCQAFGWTKDCQLMAAAVSGPECENIQIIELD